MLTTNLETVPTLNPGEVILDDGASIRFAACSGASVLTIPARENRSAHLSESGNREGGTRNAFQAEFGGPIRSRKKCVVLVVVPETVVAESEVIQLVGTNGPVFSKSDISILASLEDGRWLRPDPESECRDSGRPL